MKGNRIVRAELNALSTIHLQSNEMIKNQQIDEIDEEIDHNQPPPSPSTTTTNNTSSPSITNLQILQKLDQEIENEIEEIQNLKIEKSHLKNLFSSSSSFKMMKKKRKKDKKNEIVVDENNDVVMVSSDEREMIDHFPSQKQHDMRENNDQPSPLSNNLSSSYQSTLQQDEKEEEEVRSYNRYIFSSHNLPSHQPSHLSSHYSS